jgi:hypothetical protein
MPDATATADQPETFSNVTPIEAPETFSNVTPIASPDPLRGASQATGLSADTRGPFRRTWDEIQRGLTSAQPGQGLKPQPTMTANAAQFAGMAADTLAQYGVAPPAAEAAGALENMIPSTQRAAKNFQELKGTIGNHTVNMTDRLSNSLADIKDAVDTGSTLPTVINKFVTRIADIDQGPLTYKEARQFYSNVSDLSASERMAAKPKDLRLIQEFKHALGETIGNTAEDAGRLQQYQDAMKEYASAARLKEGLKTVGKAALATAGLGGAASGVYNAYRTLKDLAGR